MNVSDIMHPLGEGIASNATLSEAAVKMRDLQTDFLPVNEDSKLVGIVTDRDIVTRGVVSGRDSNRILVSEVMTLYIETISSDAIIAEAAQKMRENPLQRLIVVDRDGSYVGVLTAEQIHQVSDAFAPLPAV